MYIGTWALVTRENAAGELEALHGRKYPQAKFGAGKWSGPGGKQDPGESFELCIQRETQEEFDIMPDMATAKKIAIVTFYAAGAPNFEMHCYHIPSFAGTPRPTKEMLEVAWFTLGTLPFGEMYESDPILYRKFFTLVPFRAFVYYARRQSGLILPIEIMPLSP